MSTTQGVFRVLLAEDDPLTLNLLISTLTESGYLVDYCGNGRSALEMTKQRSYALLITDLHMPIMSGDELIRSLRDRGETLPALLISGSGSDVAQKLVEEVEFARFLPKPFSPSDLRKHVGELAGKVRG